MTVTVTSNSNLTVPERVQCQAGIKAGDRIEFKVSPHTINITATPQRAYEPTQTELAAIRKGEAQLARGQSIPLNDLLHELDSHRRKGSAKGTGRVSL